MKIENIKEFLKTISTPIRLVTIVSGKRDSFEFDGEKFPEGLEAVYPCDYVLENEYHKKKFDEYIDSLVPAVEQAQNANAPRRGRPPKKVMEGNFE